MKENPEYEQTMSTKWRDINRKRLDIDKKTDIKEENKERNLDLNKKQKNVKEGGIRYV